MFIQFFCFLIQVGSFTCLVLWCPSLSIILAPVQLLMTWLPLATWSMTADLFTSVREAFLSILCGLSCLLFLCLFMFFQPAFLISQFWSKLYEHLHVHTTNLNMQLGLSYHSLIMNIWVHIIHVKLKFPCKLMPEVNLHIIHKCILYTILYSALTLMVGSSA